MNTNKKHNHICRCGQSDEGVDLARRHMLAGVAAAGAVGAATIAGSAAHAATDEAKATYADPDNPAPARNNCRTERQHENEQEPACPVE